MVRFDRCDFGAAIAKSPLQVPRMSLQSDGFTGTFKGKAPVVITDVAAECGWTATAVWSE